MQLRRPIDDLTGRASTSSAAFLARLGGQLERGDSDMSGSTVRTMVIVCLVCFVVPAMTIGLIRLAGWVADHVSVISVR